VRLVLDTNVFVSGVFFSGPSYRILEAWRDGKLRLIISPEILREYERVGEELADRFPAIDLRPILELATVEAELFTPRELPEPICADPDDDKFIACALAGKSRMVVSGDKHLLKLSGFRGIQVLRPREFVDTYLGETGKI
jgi:putative PIN family toxin of toxin-antitoxin system